MRNCLVLIILCISGCSSIVTNEPYASNVANKCFEVVEPFDIYLREDYASKEYIVGTDESYIRMWGTFREKKSVVTTLPVGAELKVIRIQSFSRGSTGRCWRVYAKSEENFSEEFELPACWSLTSNPWVSPDSPWDLKQGGLNLEMNTKYLEIKHACKNS